MNDAEARRVRFVSEAGLSTQPSAPAPLVSGHEAGEARLVRHRTANEGRSATPCNIIFPQSAYQRIVTHLKHDTSREHGGFLLGYEYRDTETETPTVVIEDAVEGRFTEGTPVRLKFTIDTFRDLDQIIESRRCPGRYLQRIGWYHSHPNISIFLSHWDLDVCTIFDRRQFPIALVVDPVRDCGGFFARGKEGYQADRPQGFLEKCDVAPVPLVTWSNMILEDPESKQTGRGPTQRPRLDVQYQEPLPTLKAPRYQLLVTTCALLALAMSCLIAVSQFQMWRELRQLASTSTRSRLSPDHVTLKPGEQQRFVVLLNEHDANSEFQWSLDPADQEAGMISPDGVYSAPPSASAERTVAVKANGSDPNQWAAGSVTIVPGPNSFPEGEASVTVTPSSAGVGPHETVPFQGFLRGLEGSVKWNVQAGPGTISSTGVYLSPSSIAGKSSATIKATSTSDPKVSGTATVHLQAPDVEVTLKSKPDTTVGPGQKITISATVSGTKNRNVEWSYSPHVGTLQRGVYTAPSSINQQQAIDIKATSSAAPTQSASLQITLKPPASPGSDQSPSADKSSVTKNTATTSSVSEQSKGSTSQSVSTGSTSSASAGTDQSAVGAAVMVSVSPRSHELKPGDKLWFVAMVKGADDQSVTWSVDPADIGTITKDGHFTAAGVTTRVEGHVKATSKADPTKSATASVVILPPAANTPGSTPQ
jgi:proteasome lid subunit RPN8/RPN11